MSATQYGGQRGPTDGRRDFKRPSSDLVWDGGLRATAFVDDGAPLTTSADVGWTPDLLIATAAGTALMTLVLRLASEAGIDIVDYVSEQRLHGHPENGCPGILVVPRISVRSQRAADLISSLMAVAIEMARENGTLSRHSSVEPHVSVVWASGARG